MEEEITIYTDSNRGGIQTLDLLGNENREGYKKTKLGWIPEEWEVKRIDKIARTKAGGTPSTKIKSYWINGTIPWMSSGELNLKVVNDVEGRITEEGLANSSANLIPPNSILIGLAGQGKTRGTAATNSIELCTNQSVAAIIPTNRNIYFKYLYYNIDSRYDELRRLSTGDGGRGGLNLRLINAIKIPIPKFPEQTAIAACLSTWDTAITTLTQLIAKKQEAKKGLMQQLLSGKKRLPGFEGEWEEAMIKDQFDEVIEKNDGAAHVPLSISAGKGFVPQQIKFDKVIAGTSLANYTLLQKGDFSYNKGNSKSYEMGCIYLLENFDEGLVPFVFISFRPKQHIDALFYKHFFINHGLDQQLKRIISSGARGDGLLNVNKKSFFKLKVPYPNLKEQTAIAQVLQSADAEIGLLTQKLYRLKEQKKGLIQVLLTGRKRLEY